MTSPKASPTYWIVAGLILLVLAGVVAAANGGSDNSVPALAAIVGVGMLAYGLVVKAVAAGVRASRDD